MKILTLALFGNDDEIVKKEDWAEYIFNLEDVSSCNESTIGCTTLRFKSGYDQSVAIKWHKFKELFLNDDILPLKATIIDTEIAYKANYKL